MLILLTRRVVLHSAKRRPSQKSPIPQSLQGCHVDADSANVTRLSNHTVYTLKGAFGRMKHKWNAVIHADEFTAISSGVLGIFWNKLNKYLCSPLKLDFKLIFKYT